MKLVLFGYPLEHSKSPSIFSDFFSKEKINLSYELVPVKETFEIIEFVKSNTDIIGFNVTIPHKKSIVKYLNTYDEIVKKTSSVNTVLVERKNNAIFLHGFNTDVYGFSQSIKPFLGSNHHKALILGNGGASASVQYALKEIGVECNIITRNCIKSNHFSWEDINENMIRFHKLIINTTPIGMFPKIDESPTIPYSSITHEHLVYDLIYNPPKTKFLENAEKQGATIINGYDMLIFQAQKSWEIFKKNV